MYYKLTPNQIIFLKMIRDLSSTMNCDYNCNYTNNIKTILADGFYDDTQKESITHIIIPEYKQWKKALDVRRAYARSLHMNEWGETLIKYET